MSEFWLRCWNYPDDLFRFGFRLAVCVLSAVLLVEIATCLVGFAVWLVVS